MPNIQIKSKERVSARGEVYTNAREVNAMLDLVKKQASEITATFLEPSCGNGNFLVEIFARKLKTVERMYGKNAHDFELYALQAASSIYGVDIMEDNVREARVRLCDSFTDVYEKRFNKMPSEMCRYFLQYILCRNIQCGDTLTCKDAEGRPLVISEWIWGMDDCFTRRVYYYCDMVQNGDKAVSFRSYTYANMVCLAAS